MIRLTTNDYHILVPGTGTSGLPGHRMADTNSFHALEIEYLRRRGVTGLEYLGVFNGDLFSKAWKTGQPENVEDIDDEWERFTVRDTETSETNSVRFGCVRLLFNP